MLLGELCSHLECGFKLCLIGQIVQRYFGEDGYQNVERMAQLSTELETLDWLPLYEAALDSHLWLYPN